MDFIFDPSLVLYLPLYKLDGASFMDRSAYGHLCTVTGAVWTPQGRDFDGSDDYIDLDDIDAVDFGAGDFCLIAWVKRDAIDTSHMIFGKDNGGSYEQFVMRISSSNGIRIRYWTAPGTAVQLDTSAIITDTTEFHCIGAQRNGDSFDVFKDGELFESGTTGGTHGTMQSVSSKLYIGARARPGAENYFGGIIGEVLAFRRSFTAPEHLNYYMATKWRYK